MMEYDAQDIEKNKCCSDYADALRDQYTLWFKVKDRLTGQGTVPSGVIADIKTWAFEHDIKFDRPLNQISMRYAVKYYIGIFPRNEAEMNAIKIVWGEYLTNRHLSPKWL